MQPSNRKLGSAKSRDSLLSLPVRPSLAPVRGSIRSAVETKYVDLAETSYNCDTTGTITSLNLIAEGDDNTNRNGRRVLIRDVAVSGYSFPTVATGLKQQHRFMLVWDNAPNGTAATIALILSAVNTTAFPNPNGVNRFTILWDHTHVLGVDSATIVDQVIKQFSAAVRVNCVTQFSGTTAAAASVQNGLLYLVTIGSLAAGTTAGTANVSTRVTFNEVQ